MPHCYLVFDSLVPFLPAALFGFFFTLDGFGNELITSQYFTLHHASSCFRSHTHALNVRVFCTLVSTWYLWIVFDFDAFDNSKRIAPLVLRHNISHKSHNRHTKSQTKSHITHHTSHITHHTSHIKHHTSHITHHTSQTDLNLATQSLPLISALDFLQLFLYITIITSSTHTTTAMRIISLSSTVCGRHDPCTSFVVSLSSSLLSDFTLSRVTLLVSNKQMRWG
jgi:hypothetical protein